MAKKFRFKLAPVLKYRETIQEERRTRYLQIQEMRNQKIRELEALKGEASAAVESMVDAQTGTMDVSRIKLLNRYITGLNVSQQQRSMQLRSIEGEAEKRREELVVARKDVRVMEKLQDKRLGEYEYEERREETKTYDEIASQAHRRRSIQEGRNAGLGAMRTQAIAAAAYGGASSGEASSINVDA